MTNITPQATLRAVVVDDEPLARSSIRLMLQAHRDIEVVGECSSGLEALATIRRTSPHLIFLDIQMPECDGFDVIEQLGFQSQRSVIFVTAYDQYAIRAFEAGALDYLLKPFDNARFERTLARARDQIAIHQGAVDVRADRLIVKSGAEIIFLSYAEIDWIEAADYYVCLHMGTKTHLLRRSLKDLDGELDKNLFLRIHRSCIVRMDRVKRLVLNTNGDYAVILLDGTELNLSRRYRSEALMRLGVRAATASLV
jgi:two-component system, LytTR family, response regulator